MNCAVRVLVYLGRTRQLGITYSKHAPNARRLYARVEGAELEAASHPKDVGEVVVLAVARLRRLREHVAVDGVRLVAERAQVGAVCELLALEGSRRHGDRDDSLAEELETLRGRGDERRTSGRGAGVGGVAARFGETGRAGRIYVFLL